MVESAIIVGTSALSGYIASEFIVFVLSVLPAISPGVVLLTSVIVGAVVSAYVGTEIENYIENEPENQNDNSDFYESNIIND